MNNSDETNKTENIPEVNDMATDEEAIKKTPPTETNLELQSLSWKDKIKHKKEQFKANTEGMTKKEKFNYFLYYYKWKIVFFALILFCAISLPITIYKNTRPLVLAYAIVNNDPLTSPSSKPIDEYMDFYNFDNKYRVMAYPDIHLSAEEYAATANSSANSVSYSQFPTLCYNGHIDVIITDMTGLEFCAQSNIIQPLSTAVPTDYYDAIYNQGSNYIVSIQGFDNSTDYYAINISSTDFANKLNLSYDDVYLCFPGNSDPERTNVKRFLNFIFKLDFDI